MLHISCPEENSQEKFKVICYGSLKICKFILKAKLCSLFE